jgi:hypothetical protein
MYVVLLAMGYDELSSVQDSLQRVNKLTTAVGFDLIDHARNDAMSWSK